MKSLRNLSDDLKEEGFLVFYKIEESCLKLYCTKKLSKLEYFMLNSEYNYLPPRYVKYLGINYEQLQEI